MHGREHREVAGRERERRDEGRRRWASHPSMRHDFFFFKKNLLSILVSVGVAEEEGEAENMEKMEKMGEMGWHDRMQKERAWGHERMAKEAGTPAVFCTCRILCLPRNSHTSQTAPSFIPKDLIMRPPLTASKNHTVEKVSRPCESLFRPAASFGPKLHQVGIFRDFQNRVNKKDELKWACRRVVRTFLRLSHPLRPLKTLSRGFATPCPSALTVGRAKLRANYRR